MFPEAGERLGPYEILGTLGGGGMARVFRAWDGRLHREVAVKVIDDHYAMPGIGERFLREARAASALNHPNICTIFDIGDKDGTPYLVMELLEGETLKSRLARAPLKSEEIVRHGAEIASALGAAHARGIIHRDIKPANIFLVRNSNGAAQAKVLDFGLAKVEQYAGDEPDQSQHLTTAGATVGTVSYMSPEQARGEPLDARSDLFSLGILLYEMATGALPFQGTTSALVYVQLLAPAPPQPVRDFNGEIPADLEAIILRLLAKTPRIRYQTAPELVEALSELAETGRLRPSRLSGASADGPGPAAPQTMSRALYPIRPDDDERRAGLAELPPFRLPAPVSPWDVRAGSSYKRDLVQRHREGGGYALGNGNASDVTRPEEPAGSSSNVRRPARKSIASTPRTSYPAVSPYSGQARLHRTASAWPRTETGPGNARDRTDPSATARSAAEREARIAQLCAAAANALAAEAADSSLTATSSRDRGRTKHSGGRLNWKLVAIAATLLALVCGAVAWRMGFLG